MVEHDEELGPLLNIFPIATKVKGHQYTGMFT